MKNDEQIKDDLQTIDALTIEGVCDTLRCYNRATRDYLASFVASICDVDTNEMLEDTKHLHNSHARWLFWYAYRYMTNENYDCIAKQTSKYRLFSNSCVCGCVSKMAIMIDAEPIWKKRWTIVKRIIKAIFDVDTNVKNETKEITLKVLPPDGIDVKLQVIK